MPMRHPNTAVSRSAIMRAVKGRDTGPERAVAAILKSLKLRARTNVKSLPGSPDFVLSASKLAIFVHGCFWHGHSCARGARAPKTNAAYWTQKIARNRARDARTRRGLNASGYAVMVIWECRLKRPARVAARIARAMKRAQASPPEPARSLRRSAYAAFIGAKRP